MRKRTFPDIYTTFRVTIKHQQDLISCHTEPGLLLHSPDSHPSWGCEVAGGGMAGRREAANDTHIHTEGRDKLINGHQTNNQSIKVYALIINWHKVNKNIYTSQRYRPKHNETQCS